MADVGRKWLILPAALAKDLSTASGGTQTTPAFGSVEDAGVAIPPGAEAALRLAVVTHNSSHGRDPARRATMANLRRVYRRGSRAYRPKNPASPAAGTPTRSMARHAHAMRRVRAHLALLAHGKPTDSRYVRDNDLLPASHPVRRAESKGLPVEAKGAVHWDEKRHPRDKNGKFASVGAMVKTAAGEVGRIVAHNDDGSVQVTVKAKGSRNIGRVENMKPGSLTVTKAPTAGEKFSHHDSTTGKITHYVTHADGRSVAPGGEGGSAPEEPHQKARYDAARAHGHDHATAMEVATGTRRDGQAYGDGYTGADPRKDPAYDHYTERVNATLDALKSDNGDTQTMFDHVNGVKGAYTPEREQVHRQILDEFLKRHENVPADRKAIVMAGPSGAGKSTAIKNHGADFGVESTVDQKGNVSPTNYATVNPDDFKELLREKGGLPKEYDGANLQSGEYADVLHEESSDLAKRAQAALQARGKNVLLDGTFSGAAEKQADKVEGLRKDGYKVAGVLIDGDVERSLAQAAARHGLGNANKGSLAGGLSGRYVRYKTITDQRANGAQSAIFGREHRSSSADNFEKNLGRFEGGAHVYERQGGNAVAKTFEQGPLAADSADRPRTVRSLAPGEHARINVVNSEGEAERIHGVVTDNRVVESSTEDRPGAHDLVVGDRTVRLAGHGTVIARPSSVDEALLGQRTAEARTHAQGVIAKAVAAQPQTTADLTEIADDVGGTMQMLHRAVKGEDSLTRKIRDKAANNQEPQAAYAARVGDALRYTMELPDDGYGTGIQRALGTLQARGYTLVGEPENQWAPPGEPRAYQAIHANLVTPGGQPFELQFHTPETLAAKAKIHADYEIMRDVERFPLADRQEAFDRMAAIQTGIPVPPGSRGIGKPAGYGRPTKGLRVAPRPYDWKAHAASTAR